MNALGKIKTKLNSLEFLLYLLGASLSLLLVGYAPSSIALGLFCIMSFRYFIVKKRKIQFNFALFLPVLLYLLFAASYFWSVDQEQTLKGLGRMVILLLIPITFTLLPIITLKNYRLIIRIFTFSNAILGVFFLSSALYNFINTGSVSVFTYHELVSVLDLNAIYVTVIFSVSLFYLLSIKNKTKLEKSAIVYFLILVLLLSSKIIILVLFIGLFVYLIKNNINVSNKKKIVPLAIFVIVALIISSVTLSERFSVEKRTELNEVFTKGTFGKVYYWTGSSIRLFQLRNLKEQIKDESILFNGFGLFASKKDLKKRHLKYDTYFGFHDYNYHNQYAQILSESGLIGLFLLLLIIVVLTNKAIISKDYGFIMFTIMIMIVFFTESFLWRQRGLFLFVTLYCLYNRVLFQQTSTEN